MQAALTLIGGGLFFTSHEADMVHLSDLVLRQSAGAVFHHDIATPVGGWATLPMALLHRAGLGLGSAMVWGQMVALVVLLPPLALIALRRLTVVQAAVFGLCVTGLTGALVFGGTDPLVSLSMHYNRWCWAASSIVVLAVFLPGTRPKSVGEGIAIGWLMAAMAMIKVSFPVALALPVIFGLLRNGRTKTLLAAIGTALIVLGAVTMVLGVGYWQAYLADLLTVAGSPNRAAPGADWRALILSPAGLPVTLVAAALIYFGGRIGRKDLAALTLLFFAAFTFISWQNYGNDPIWLAVIALIGWCLSQGGQGAGYRGLRMTAVAAGVLVLPMMANVLYSPLRHVLAPADLSRPLLPGDASLRMVTARAEAAFAKVTLVAPPDQTAAVFRGRDLPECELSGGLITTLERDAAELTRLDPTIDRQPLVADLFQAHWMFAGLRPLQGGTPWYYDGLPGLADATHVMVPDCPADLRARQRVTDLLDQAGVTLEEVGRTEAFTLYRITGQENAANAT